MTVAISKNNPIILIGNAGGGGGAGEGSVTSVGITQPANGITVSGGPITSSGSFTMALADDLAAVEGLSSTGMAARTASNTWAVRTVTGTTNRISVSNGSGVSGNPTIDIDTNYAGQNTITTVGTISSGTWNGSVVGANYGGTGTTTGVIVPVAFTLAQGSAATTGTNKTAIVIMPTAGTITKAFIAAKTAPTGQALICDINKNGTSIWASNQGNRIQLSASATSSTQTSFDTTSLSEGDQLTIDIDQIGSGTAGQDITVVLNIRTA